MKMMKNQFLDNEYIIRGNNMAKKIIKEAVKKTIKKFKPNPNAPQSRAISGAPEKGTVGAQKASKAKATPARRGRPKGSTNKATGVTAQRRSARATKAKGTAPVPAKVPTAIKAAAIAPAAGLTALAVTSKRKPSAKASEVTFGEAFKAARKKGESCQSDRREPNGSHSWEAPHCRESH